jgi:hypothetical protein
MIAMPINTPVSVVHEFLKHAINITEMNGRCPLQVARRDHP